MNFLFGIMCFKIDCIKIISLYFKFVMNSIFDFPTLSASNELNWDDELILDLSKITCHDLAAIWQKK